MTTNSVMDAWPLFSAGGCPDLRSVQRLVLDPLLIRILIADRRKQENGNYIRSMRLAYESTLL